MDSSDLSVLERQVRMAYEWGRARRALGLASVAAAPGVIAWALGGGVWALGLALVAYVGYALCLWRGRWLGRGALAGLLWGLVPFTLAHLAQPLGGCHVGGECYSWCSVACAVGGLTVGAGVSWLASRTGSPLRYWAAGSAVAILTGMAACRCAGVGSVAGLALGLLVTSLPLVPRLLARRRSA